MKTTPEKTNTEENEIGKLLQLCYELVVSMDKMTDKTLPLELAKVVKLHSKLALGTALIPIPAGDAAASIANIWSMYTRINKKLGIPLNENIGKTILSGIVTNLVSYGIGMAVGSLLKTLPGLGTVVGTAIMLPISYAITLTAGHIYLTALCTLARRKVPITKKALEDAIDIALKNKETVGKIYETAKKDYKNNKKTIKSEKITLKD